MTNQQVSNDQLEELIVETVNTMKPKTTQDLVKLVKQICSASDKAILAVVFRLESENRIHFAKKTSTPLTLSKTHLISISSSWFWLILAAVIATAIAVAMIPENNYPLVYLRQALGAVYVLFLPGFVFLKTLYPTKVPMATSSENLDTIERIALSIGLSIALTAILGLILNYTAWGIRIIPITLSLLALTLVFAIAGLLREYQARVDFRSSDNSLIK